LLALVSLLVLPERAGADTISAISSGTWNDGNIWSGSTVPTSADTVNINGGFTVNVTSVVSGSAHALLVGETGTGALILSGGQVTNFAGAIGAYAGSNGTVTVNSGTWTNSDNLQIGFRGTGNLTVNDGSVIVTGATGFYLGNGTLAVNGGSVSSIGDLLLDSSGDNNTSTATITGGTLSTNNRLIMGAGGINGQGTLNISGGTVTNANIAVMGWNASALDTVNISGSGVWNSTGSLTIGQSGTGILNLTGGALSVSSNIVLASNGGSVGTLNLGGTNVGGSTVGTLTATGIIGASGTATVNFNNSGALTLATVMSGALTVNQIGAGTTTLTGTNTYTGATTINAGTLLVDGSTASGSAFAVNGSGTLGGSGTINGSVAVVGTLSPGNCPGILNTGAEIWYNTGNYNWQILDATAGAGTGFDAIAITGGLDLSNLTTAGFSINLWSLSSTGPDVNGNASNFVNTNNYSWTLATTTTGVTGFNAADFTINTIANNGTAGFINPLNGSFSVGVTGNDLMLIYTSVPEPTTWALLAAGLTVLVTFHRRRA